jgi:hypothetical protein
MAKNEANSKNAKESDSKDSNAPTPKRISARAKAAALAAAAKKEREQKFSAQYKEESRNGDWISRDSMSFRKEKMPKGTSPLNRKRGDNVENAGDHDDDIDGEDDDIDGEDINNDMTHAMNAMENAVLNSSTAVDNADGGSGSSPFKPLGKKIGSSSPAKTSKVGDKKIRIYKGEDVIFMEDDEI